MKWAGLLSDPINIKQGVRQGGVLSTTHYKRYNNPLLLQLEDHYTSVRIGSINIPHVTVADDLAVMARRHSDMQVMIWDVENNTDMERYCVNPTKSYCQSYNASSKDDKGFELIMSGDKISCDRCTVHLGITRDTREKVNIEEKLTIHKNARNLFMSISRNKHFLEYEIAERQIAMKDFEDKSWFNLIR